MVLSEIKYNDTNQFSKLFVDYTEQKDNLKKLISEYPKIENFKKQIKAKSESFDQSVRPIIKTVIKNQYKGISLNNIQKKNLNSILNKNTYTVTTGHQLNIFTGPLYFIYKIFSTINLTEILKKKYPKYDFVPIYWMATEDHDFAEINNFYCFDRVFNWDSNQSGCVGDFNTDSIKNTIEELNIKISNFKSYSNIISIIKNSYLNSNNLSDATRKFVNELFKEYGLLIIDPNDKQLKSNFSKIIKSELLENLIYNHSKEYTSLIKELGYKVQVNPRDINLFYIENGKRVRIVKRKNDFITNDKVNSWTENEIIEEIKSSPDRFSPNVLLRPLYQEFILPNLCYVGGPSEICYWLQLKSVFDASNISYPLLLNRNSALLISEKQSSFLKKNKLDVKDLLMEKNELEKKLVKTYSKIKFDFLPLENALNDQFSILRKIAEKTDKSFIGSLHAQEKKQIKGLQNLKKRLLKAEKRYHYEKINKIIEFQKSFFPLGIFQERIVNFIEFCKEDRSSFLKKIKENLNPLNNKFTVIEI
tara:strand:+ start:195 stop:1790 length:1596 start_codon:yes stop_codon:yes gene_type:complete